MAAKSTKFRVVDKDNQKVGTVTTKVEAPLIDKSIPEFEKPILSVTISNPFKKILYWLDQIRRHQTTTIAFKLSIPLIAIPVLVFAVYQIGRGAGISFVKSQITPTPSISKSPNSQTPQEISRAGTLRIARGTSQTRYLLALRNGEIVNLEIPASIDLSKYANKQVLVTGFQNKTTGVISVGDIAEIEVFNATIIPKPSPVTESTTSAN